MRTVWRVGVTGTPDSGANCAPAEAGFPAENFLFFICLRPHFIRHPRFQVKRRFVQFDRNDHIAFGKLFCRIPTLKINRLRIGGRGVMKHPAADRIQVVETYTLVPAVGGCNPVFHYAKHSSIDREQSNRLVTDGCQGESSRRKFGDVESDEIDQTLLEQLVEIGLRRANHQANFRIQGPRRKGRADIYSFVAGGEQDSAARIDASGFECGVAAAITNR
jgi:hypothetical protein